NGARTLALAWVGRDEDARFLPLDRAGSPTAPPSGEDALKDARPLLFLDRLGGPPADGSSSLVASPSGSEAQLRGFACAKWPGRARPRSTRFRPAALSTSLRAWHSPRDTVALRCDREGLGPIAQSVRAPGSSP